MQDWATFFFTGSNVLPAFMVLSDDSSFALAILVYLGLLLTGCFFALRDEHSPVRRAVVAERRHRSKSRKQD